jgi:hypothetical protein
MLQSAGRGSKHRRVQTRSGSHFSRRSRSRGSRSTAMGLRIYVMTDMAGVAGVVNSDDYCNRDSRYYEVGRELTTLEA